MKPFFKSDSSRYRFSANAIFIIIFSVFTLLAYRLYSIQVSQHTDYAAIQEQQIWAKESIPAPRGKIVDRNGNILAASAQVNSLYADPSEIENPQSTAWIVSDVLGINYEEALGQITKDKDFVWLKRKLSDEQFRYLANLKINGLYFMKEYDRFYPNGSIAANLLGFCGIDENGLDGIEFFYNKMLAGKQGFRMSLKDARQKKLMSVQKEFVPPVSGNDVMLTIDLNIQYIADQALQDECKKWNPASAVAIVIDPWTGEILALSNYPTYDPNNPNLSPNENRRNRVATDPFEPGSTFKPFVASIALQEGLTNPEQRFFCENGVFKIQKRTLHDHKPYGWLTFHEVLTKSSNIGMAKVGLMVEKDLMYTYINAFDFGKPTGLNLPGESYGKTTSYPNWSYYTTTSVPMGHEISVTPLQMAKAYACFANGGYLLKPEILKKIVSPEGAVLEENQVPSIIRRILTDETCEKMNVILTDVIETGTGRKAKISVPSAGKTGTTKKLDPDGSYSHTKYIASFVQFAPVDNPRLLIMVSVNEPKNSIYGGEVAAPISARILQQSLDYLNIAELCQKR